MMQFPGVFPPVLAPGQPIDCPVVYFDHFVASGKGTNPGEKFGTTADTAEWLVTLVNSAAAGVPTIQDLVSALTPGAKGGSTVGGVIKSTTTGANNDSVTAQINGEAFNIRVDSDIWAECRFATSAIAGTTFLWGLAATGMVHITDTTFATTVADFIGFKVTGTSGALIAVVKGAGTETTYATGVSLVNNTWSVLRFEVQPNYGGNFTVRFYVDGQLVATHRSTNANTTLALPLSSVGLSPAFAGKTQATTAFSMYFDYMLFAQRDA